MLPTQEAGGTGHCAPGNWARGRDVAGTTLGGRQGSWKGVAAPRGRDLATAPSPPAPDTSMAKEERSEVFSDPLLSALVCKVHQLGLTASGTMRLLFHSVATFIFPWGNHQEVIKHFVSS